MERKIDPIIVAVLDNRLLAITEEMAKSLLRTSRSPIWSEARDFATAIFTQDLKLIAQRDYLPALATAIPVAMENIAKTYEGDINEGDIFIHNDVYTGNNHLPDINVAKPVFYHGELVFWAVAKGHVADVGGRGLAGYDPAATTIWEEGLIIPACKLYDRGKRNRSIWDLLGKNIKIPDMVLGDIMCEVGGVITGERSLIALLQLYGKETLYAAIDEIIAATEKEIRDKIRQIPDGVYYGEKSYDYDSILRDKPVTVKCKVIKQGDEVTVDWSDSDPQAPGYLNSSWAHTFSATHLALFCILPGDIKRNEGSLRPIKVIALKGTIMNAEFPGSIAMCTSSGTGPMAEAIWLALSKAVPHWASAGQGNLLNHPCVGFNPRTKRMYVEIDFLTNSLPSGGTEGYDGWDIGGPACTMGQLRAPDFEIMELVNPLRYLQFEQIPDSEGAGKFRGGFAHMMKVENVTDRRYLILGDGTRDSSVPSGLFGGKSPKPNKIVMHRLDGREEEVPNHIWLETKGGEILEQYVQGSAGYGEPWERDPEKVGQDVYDERVSIERARDVYGVVINPSTLEVDIKATEELRKRPKK